MLLVTVRVLLLLKMAPPWSVALLPAKVLLVTVGRPGAMRMTMAPPALAVLPVNVLLVTAKSAPLAMAPPNEMALLPEEVLVVMVRVAASSLMAPPSWGRLVAEE